MNPLTMLRRATIPTLLGLSLGLGMTCPARAATPEQADLAERLMQTAMGLTESAESFPVAAVLADAAERMMPEEKRLVRYAADLRLRLGQRDQAIDLLNRLRRLDPADQLAQVQTIDLLVDRMESADQKAAYLRQVTGAASVPAEVRSHAAVQLAGIEAERGRDNEAIQAIDEALKLNPLNPRALQLRLDRVMVPGTPPQERAAVLVAILQANPMAMAALGMLADELARVGATEQSIALYKHVLSTVEAGTPVPPEDLVNYAAVLLSVGQTKAAVTPAQMATQLAPHVPEGQFMRALVAQQLGDKETATAAYNEARDALIRTLMHLHAALDPQAAKPDDSRPVLPDVKADAAVLAKGEHPRLAQAYQAALGDLIWLDAFFAATAPNPVLAEAITTIGPDKNNDIPRAAAIAALVRQQYAEAKALLTPLVERQDLLARAAMLVARLKTGEDKELLTSEAHKIVAQVPTGLWGATLKWILNDFAPFDLRTADTAAVVAEAGKLSSDWLAFGRNGRSFYVVDVDVVKAQVDVGQPMLISVTMQNLGTRPLVIGPGGAVDQQVIIDATVRGAIEQPFPGAAVARMTGALVLHPRQRITTYVRIDNPQVFSFLAANPHVSMGVFVSAIANPMLTPNGIIPGPGGFRVLSRSVFDRRVAALQRPEGRQQLIDQLARPDAMQRLSALQAIAGNGLQLGQQDGPEQRQLAVQAAALVKKSAEEDASPTVRAIAMQLVVALTAESQRDEPIKAMLASKDAEARLLGALLVMGRSQADRQAMLSPLTSDADDVVQRLAKAIIALPDLTPVTQPGS